jgi:hypothetical protein
MSTTGFLIFNIAPSAGETIKTNVYGYYHGHLIETFLNHFNKDFEEGAATSMPTLADTVSSQTANAS